MVLVEMLEKLRTTIIFSFLFFPQISLSLDYSYSVYSNYKDSVKTYFVIIKIDNFKYVKPKNIFLYAKEELISFIKINNDKVSSIELRKFNLDRVEKNNLHDYFIFSVSKDNILIE